MTDTFNPAIAPQTGAAGDIKFNTRDARFGDGYVQAVAEGLNNKSQIWPLSFVGTYAEIAPIKQFFDDQEGYKSFYWTPPDGIEGLYRAKGYSFTAHAGMNAVLTVRLEEVFYP